MRKKTKKFKKDFDVPMVIYEFINKKAEEEERPETEIMRRLIEFGTLYYSRELAEELKELGIHKTIKKIHLYLPTEERKELINKYRSDFTADAKMLRTLMYIGMQHYGEWNVQKGEES